MEVVTMLRIMDGVKNAQPPSYDPYTCEVLQHYFYECLDIAGPKTLGSSISNASVFNISDTAFSELSDGLNTSSTSYFGGDALCHDKTTGDGAINAFDVAVLTYYQFEMPPYDRSLMERN